MGKEDSKGSIREELGENGFEEIAGPGTETRTESWTLEQEMEKIELRRIIRANDKQMQMLKENFEEQIQPLIAENLQIEAKLIAIEKELEINIGAKMDDVKKRKEEEKNRIEEAKAVEVG